VSTPTGSTGYSLSAGGPLVMPQTGNFIIAPINPHSLTVRPVIVPDTSKIELKIEGRSKKVLISLDHRSESVPIEVKFELRKEDFYVNLIRVDSSSYFNTLRNKLNWGLDSRN
jgi:NAD+ kinase